MITLIIDIFIDIRNDNLDEDKLKIYEIYPLKCDCILRKPDIYNYIYSNLITIQYNFG